MDSDDGDAAQFRHRSEADSDSEFGHAIDEQRDDRYDDAIEEEIVATPEMCLYCFDTLVKALLPEPPPPSSQDHGGGSPKRQHRRGRSALRRANEGVDAIDVGEIRRRLQVWRASYAPPAVDCPLFVTWSKLRSGRSPPLLEAFSSGLATPASTTASSSNVTDDEASSTQDEADYDLRGCIGTLAPKCLDDALAEFAVTSALHDQRFDPIALHELPCLRVSVSLLVGYEECDHYLDWVVGVHGIIIKFDCPSRRKGRPAAGTTLSPPDETAERVFSATYLPEVAHEQGWDCREAVLSLVRKAGYRGIIDDDLLARIRCTRYRSSKCRMSYQEYALARHGGADLLLGDPGAVTAAAVNQAMRQKRAKALRPCINL